jgi:protocatechuate 3,4-dioxygenase beta subunit
MPGKLLRSKELKQIRRIIKEPGKAEYDMTPFFFNDDPLLPELTLACQAEAAMSMLRINEKDGMLTANKDIKLTKNSPTDL